MEIPKLYKLKFETEIVWEEQIEESYTTVTNVSAVVLNKDLTFMKHQIDAIVQENDIAFLSPDSVVMPEKMVREVDTKLFTLNLSFRKSICTTFEWKTSAFTSSLPKVFWDLSYEDIVYGL